MLRATTLAVLASGLGLGVALNEKRTSGPNVLLFMADDQGMLQVLRQGKVS